MKDFRIVTDGIRYRIQVHAQLWYQRKPKYVFCGTTDCGFVIKDYHSLREAQKGLADIQAEVQAKIQGYQPLLGDKK